MTYNPTSHVLCPAFHVFSDIAQRVFRFLIPPSHRDVRNIDL